MTDWKRHATHSLDEQNWPALIASLAVEIASLRNRLAAARDVVSAARDVVESDALSLGDALAELAEQIKRCDAAADKT